MKPFAWTCAGVVTAAGIFTSFAAGAQTVLVADELRPGIPAPGPAYRDSYAAMPARRPPPPDADLMSPRELVDLLRADGYSPLGPAMRRGWVYTIAVLDQNGDDGRLIVDGRSGEPIRFIPAMRVDSRLNEELDYMYGPPGPPPEAFAPDPCRRGGPPVAVPAPRTARVAPPHPHGPATAAKPTSLSARSPVVEPKAQPPKNSVTSAKPDQTASVSTTPALEVSKPPAAAKPATTTETASNAQPPAVPAKPAQVVQPANAAPALLELKPTEPMPPMQTLE